MMDDLKVGQGTLDARCVGTEEVAKTRVLEGLVDGDPILDPVAERASDDTGVVLEAGGRIAVPEAARVALERQGQIPVEQRREGPHVPLQEAVDEARVEVQARPIRFTAAVRLDPRPRYGEAIRVEPELAGYGDIVGPSGVMVAGCRGIGTQALPARPRYEGVPDGRAAAVAVEASLDLERRR